MSEETALGAQLRQIAAKAAGRSYSEESMYADLAAGLNGLLPAGFAAEHGKATDSGLRPDLSISDASGATVANVEVKLSTTLASAVTADGSGDHQVARYRSEGPAVLLTDALRWFDVTASDDITAPLAVFDGSDDKASEQQLGDRLQMLCGFRPRHTMASAVNAMAGLIDRVNAASEEELAGGWATVRSVLGVDVEEPDEFGNAVTLDGSGPGEVVCFTLLSIAAHLEPLDDERFLDAAAAEWDRQADLASLAGLPALMSTTLRMFRTDIRTARVFGSAGWVQIRSLAAFIRSADRAHRWERLSRLWDDYLARVGRRKTLGSWQTPQGLARYQARQAHEALAKMGYTAGLGDTRVTIVDPCVGTGVYLDAVVQQAVESGHAPGSFNASSGSDGRAFPRLLGVDISSTAVAACHIRMADTAARPKLYMTDTLHTSGESVAAGLFDVSGGPDLNLVVVSAYHDWEQMNGWASRVPGRQPVLAIIGNPPYHHSGLDEARYQGRGWHKDVFERWREGSGGRGGLQDPLVAFWAWACQVCCQPHPDLFNGGHEPIHGVVSFVTNRNWIEGTTGRPMRRWLRQHAARIDVTDFGPGSLAGGAGRWSAQPFGIQIGVAVVTAVFDPGADERLLRYRRAVWEEGEVGVLGDGEWKPHDPDRADDPWSHDPPKHDLTSGVTTVNGVKTADDDKWITPVGDMTTIRHAYRALDNRWSPAQIPADAKSTARWNRTLFDAHTNFAANGGWYAILPARRSNPGPAIHATRHLPDYHLFKGSEGGKVVSVSAGVGVPRGYREWASTQRLAGERFWLYALAVSNHPDFWAEGTEAAQSLAEQRVALPLVNDPKTIAALVAAGSELVDVWSVDGLKGVQHSKKAGEWQFRGQDQVESTRINGRAVLAEWRKARPGYPAGWDKHTAAEYAKTVHALRRLRAISEQVGKLLGQPLAV